MFAVSQMYQTHVDLEMRLDQQLSQIRSQLDQQVKHGFLERPVSRDSDSYTQSRSNLDATVYSIQPKFLIDALSLKSPKVEPINITREISQYEDRLSENVMDS
jgi:hypothetical protein